MTNTREPRSNLSDALRAVAREEADRGASLDVKARLLNEVRAIARARRERRVLMMGVSLAASLVLVVGIAWWQWTCCTSPLQPTPTPARAVASAEVTTDFMPLMYASVPMTGGHIVRMHVPERALLAYGLAVPTAFDGSVARTVVADVLVGNDGLARAVRFVRPAVTKEQ